MKKIIIFLLITIAIICTISYMYINYNATKQLANSQNKLFNVYANEEIDGSVVATLINKATDFNEKNEISKDSKGNYIENKDNSIKIDIKFIDNDTTYNMETIYAKGINKFVEYYNNIKFKCVDIQYHKSTKKIKYLLLQQISE